MEKLHIVSAYKTRNEKIYVDLQQPVYNHIGSMNCWLIWQKIWWGIFSLNPLLLFLCLLSFRRYWKLWHWVVHKRLGWQYIMCFLQKSCKHGWNTFLPSKFLSTKNSFPFTKWGDIFLLCPIIPSSAINHFILYFELCKCCPEFVSMAVDWWTAVALAC